MFFYFSLSLSHKQPIVYVSGKIVSGAWGVVCMLLIMFYHSNLRKMIIAPSVDPEINSDKDIYKYDIKTIYTEVPHESLPIFYTDLMNKQPMMYDKVSLYLISMEQQQTLANLTS